MFLVTVELAISRRVCDIRTEHPYKSSEWMSLSKTKVSLLVSGPDAGSCPPVNSFFRQTGELYMMDPLDL
jgi:hypothetical protein